MPISTCVNRKLLRVKTTTKHENNRTLKRTGLPYINVQALGPGSATVTKRLKQQ